MNGNFIVTTPKHQMHALAYQGIMVTDCHAQLRDMLRNRLGDEYVLLFAEPAFNAADNTVDWYSPVQGPIRRLTDLPPEEQNTLRDRLAHMAKELHLFAEELRHAPESAKNTRGNVLELALRYPDESCLYVIGGQPVFTCWGYGPGTPGAEPQDLCRLTRLTAAQPAAPAPEAPAQPQPAAAVPPAPEPPRRSGLGWLWWLVPLLLLLLLLWVLFTSFGAWPALSGNALFHAPALPFGQADTAALNSRRQANMALEQDIAALRTRLGEHAALCLPEKKGTEPSKPAKTPAQQEELVIPEKTDDMAFMLGRWRCETGLVNSATNEPIVVEFQFDSKGKGIGMVYEKNDRCQGDAQASLTPEGLHVTLGVQQCAKGGTYSRQDIDCRNQNGAAHCQGKNQSGDPWDAQFFRITR